VIKGGAMNKVGFIGLGSMGGTLLESLLKYGALSPKEVIVATRTNDRIKRFITEYPDVEVAAGNIELAKFSKVIFICVKTPDVRDVFLEIKPYLHEDTHIIYINAGITARNFARVHSGKLTKIVPALTCEFKESASLVWHNDLVTSQERECVGKWLSCIGIVKIIPEDHFEIGADITSCSPGFIAAIFREYLEACLKHSRFSREEAEEMLLTTLLGTAWLLKEKKIGFDQLITSVATKGGITEEGVKVLEKRLPSVFDELLIATLSKHAVVKENMDRLYSS
jgi:pyrroline-5-carboxylate reductase